LLDGRGGERRGSLLGLRDRLHYMKVYWLIGIINSDISRTTKQLP
jgi:hypothetical protein